MEFTNHHRVARGSKFPDPTRRPDPTHESRDPTRPVNLCGFWDPTRRPIYNGKSSKTIELNVYSLLCAHTHECASQIRYASTWSRFHWLMISTARMRQRRQLNTDAYQTPPLCSQISCTYYSPGANNRIANEYHSASAVKPSKNVQLTNKKIGNPLCAFQ